MKAKVDLFIDKLVCNENHDIKIRFTQGVLKDKHLSS